MTSPQLRSLDPAEVAYIEFLLSRHDDPGHSFEEFLGQRGDLSEAIHDVHRQWVARINDTRPAIPLAFAEALLERYGSSAHDRATDDSDGPLERVEAPAVSLGSRFSSGEEVARGGMGAILKVWDHDLHRALAVKVALEPSDPAGDKGALAALFGRFVREAQVMGQLCHPGVVPIHEIGLDADGHAYFTMRFVEGDDLATIFQHSRSETDEWNQRRALEVLLKVCETIEFSHAQGVVHRDIKPQNIMVGSFGEVYVMDWGLAKILTGPGGRRREAEPLDPSMPTPLSESAWVTADGAVLGTPLYMAPEQAAGETETVGPASDIYAVGVLLYALLSGQLPYVSPRRSPSSREVLDAILAGPPEPLSRLAPDAPVGLVRICDRAMAREIGERYPTMAMLAEELRSYLGAEERAAEDSIRSRMEKDRAEQVSSFVAELFDVRDSDGVRPETITARELLDRGAERIHRDLAEEPIVQGALMRAMGAVFRNLGLNTRSEELLRASLEILQREFGDDHPDVAMAENDLAFLLRNMGRSEEADKTYRRALDKQRRLLGPDHDATLSTQNNLAALCTDLGESEEAELLLRDALSYERDAGRPTELPTWYLESLNNLGCVTQNLGKFEESEDLLRDAISMRRRARGDDDPEIATYMTNLAGLYIQMGKYDGVEELLMEALARRERVLGPDHPRISFTLNALARFHRMQKNLDRAEMFLRRALLIRRRTFGKHPVTATSIVGLGALLFDKGELEESEALYAEGLRMREETLPGDHAELANPRVGMARIERKRGGLDRAEVLLRESLAILENALGQDHATVALVSTDLAGVLIDLGRFEEAEVILVEAYSITRAAKGDASRHTASAREELVRLYEGWGKPEQAARHRC